MKRRLVNVFVALSLVTCVAAVVMWARGYWVVDIVDVSRSRTGQDGSITVEWKLVVGGDFVVVAWSRQRFDFLAPDSGAVNFSHSTMSPMDMLVERRTFWQRVGFNWFGDDYGDLLLRHWSRRTRGVRVPYWSIVLVTAVMPAARLRRVWRARRFHLGACTACGYDLTGNVSGVCPECGAARAVNS